MISSWNGVPAVTRAAALLESGSDVLDAMVAGISLVEDDPEELSVGYGGLPNEDGVVELDRADRLLVQVVDWLSRHVSSSFL
jgi:N4-(beta-N-acetylglucosaminyl)-L-asparaginase